MKGASVEAPSLFFTITHHLHEHLPSLSTNQTKYNEAFFRWFIEVVAVYEGKFIVTFKSGMTVVLMKKVRKLSRHFKLVKK